MKENCTMCRHLNRTDIAASGICMNTESDKFAYQVGKLDRCEHFEMIKPKRQDLSYGLDGRVTMLCLLMPGIFRAGTLTQTLNGQRNATWYSSVSLITARNNTVTDLL